MLHDVALRSESENVCSKKQGRKLIVGQSNDFSWLKHTGNPVSLKSFPWCNDLYDCMVGGRLTLVPLFYSDISVLFLRRYSPVEGSMKPASLLSASAPEPLFPYLSLLTSDWLTVAVNLLPPLNFPQQPAEKRLELRPFPHPTFSAIATHAEQCRQPILHAS